MDSNICKTLSTRTNFKESVPGTSTTINSDYSIQSKPELKAYVTEVIV